MTGFIIDASVAVKWLYVEPYWENALLYFDSSENLYAPDLIQQEVANAIVKKVRFSDVKPEDGWQSYTSLFQSNFITLIPVIELINRAYILAVTIEHSLHDCAYLAAAEKFKAEVVTADQKFYRRVIEHGQYSHLIHWVEEPLTV